jgi:protein SCO1/2
VIAAVALIGSGAAAWERATTTVRVPDVALVRADGARVGLRGEIDDGRPVIVSFLFTTCAAVCPVLSHTLREVQRQLGDRVHLISVSIDPDHDTPARLRAYARQLGAGPGWTFYTGTPEATVAAQRAFEAYRGDKMNHVPVLFLRTTPTGPWTRLSGFVPAADVVGEVRQQLARK